jgi:hypothetical protein
MARNEIKVIITGDTKQFEAALGRAGRKSESGFKKIGRAAGVAGLALGGALALGAKAGFDELSEAAKVGAQTEAVIKSTGKAANVTAEQVTELAESLMKKSGVDDEAIQSGENMLLTFRDIRNEVGKGNDIFDQATKATLDMSVAMGKDMPDAALIVGKALNDPVRGLTALRRVGVQFTKGQEAAIKKMVETGDVAGAQKIILEELRAEFGGSAEAAGKTLPGQLNIAKESFKNLAGEMMTALLPALTMIAENLLRLADFLSKHKTLAMGLAIGLGILAAALLAASVASMLLNLTLLANPVGLVVIAVIALAAALVVAYKKSEKFRAVVDAVIGFVRAHWQKLLLLFGVLPFVIAKIIIHFGTLRSKAQAVFSFIRGVVQSVRDAIQTVINKVSALVGWIRDKLGGAGLREKISKLAGPFNTVKDAVSALVGWLNSVWNWLKKITGKIWKIDIDIPKPSIPSPGGGVPFVPGIASGGDIARSGLAVVHRGERVLPARVVNRGGGGGGGTVRVIVVGGDRAGIDWIRQLDQDHRRTNGGRGILAT